MSWSPEAHRRFLDAMPEEGAFSSPAADWLVDLVHELSCIEPGITDEELDAVLARLAEAGRRER